VHDVVVEVRDGFDELMPKTLATATRRPRGFIKVT